MSINAIILITPKIHHLTSYTFPRFKQNSTTPFCLFSGQRARAVANRNSTSHPPPQIPRSHRSLLPNQTRRRLCVHRRLERCSWPQCNHSCPKLHNPFTGEEMDFIELLKSFGLDMESVAKALGVDMQTLNSMDHAELLNLLTQQSSR